MKEKANKETISHGFGPIFDKESEVLILGSFPSVKSREDSFYYANKTNRFFPVLAKILSEETPLGTEQRKAFLLSHHIALYDVYETVSIVGSSDTSLVGLKVSDLSPIIDSSSIKVVILNGKKALEGYLHNDNRPSLPYLSLPSTSAANALYSFLDLVKDYSSILNFLTIK